MKNLLLCTCVGDAYRSRFLAVKPQFEAYAAACGSDMEVIESPLDPAGKYGHFTQRLLIPRKFSRYEIVVHMDLDILIPKNLPDIFSVFPSSAGFSAVIDPRGSYAYQKAWGFDAWTRDSHQNFFKGLGLTSKCDLASINGGVLVMRPRLIADLAEAWYFDETKSHPGTEEAPLAYISQTHAMFAALEYRFNRQVLFGLHETSPGQIAFEEYRSLWGR
ncbi:MAG: hypothetical protein ABSG63_16255, partial [Spirochaetia bacterium]